MRLTSGPMSARDLVRLQLFACAPHKRVMSSVIRGFSTTSTLRSHENPLGLPRKEAASKNPHLAARMQRGLPQRRRVEGVRKVIAVSSAKGGVGKSTIAANIALSLSRLGHRTGILDTDIFGPSIPTLFNLTDASEPALSSTTKLLPLPSYGVLTMSMGYLIPATAATVWRGLMVTKALQQLLHEVDWKEGSGGQGLDVLVLDMPPGTGDVQLTIAQQIELDGAVLVSTPQQLALSDMLRGLKMFTQTHIKVLGLVQNMSVFVCPNCDTKHSIFGEGKDGGVAEACRKHGIEVLGDVPINGAICRDADRGVPSVVGEPDGVAAGIFMDIAKKIGAKIGL